jgi:hypothetical protein
VLTHAVNINPNLGTDSNYETANVAIEKVRALRMSENPMDRELAEKLSACREQEGQWCNLPMCQRCVDDLRSFLSAEVIKTPEFVAMGAAGAKDLQLGGGGW